MQSSSLSGCLRGFWSFQAKLGSHFDDRLVSIPGKQSENQEKCVNVV